MHEYIHSWNVNTYRCSLELGRSLLARQGHLLVHVRVYVSPRSLTLFTTVEETLYSHRCNFRIPLAMVTTVSESASVRRILKPNLWPLP
jgi:hypothetical protein